jgi:hypothetical protein
MLGNRSELIIENQMLNRRIVYAINKAISEDIPQKKREDRLETNNRYIFAVGDYINDYLRKYVVKDKIELISFKRYAWEGRIIVDRENKITYTISTFKTLKTIVRKYRNQPHYLVILLYAENGECKGTTKQMTIGDFYPEYKMSTFDVDVLDDDFDKIVQGNISKTDGYKHYIVAYTSEHDEITAIALLLLDKDFVEVDKMDLMDYINPDFASLTGTQYEGTEDMEEEQEQRPLPLKLKSGVKPALRAMEEEA